ncbi:MAG: peptidase M29 [Betaproteobacteria bacterium]|nr:peptidase M29 [Betaproteobacteria bacterium]
MLQERVEPQWLQAFEAVVARCGAGAGDTVCVLHETQSRPVLVELARLAAARRGCTVFALQLPTPAQADGIPVRSTGASDALRGQQAAIAALSRCTLVLDCTVEGLMHAAELPQVLAGGARVLYVSNEHPEALERLLPDDALEPRVKSHLKRLRAAAHMQVQSQVGTQLSINLVSGVFGANWGYTTKPGTLSHWPGGLVLAFPAAGTVSGRLVLDSGDVNLTHKRYIEQPVALQIEDDHVVQVEGRGVDAQLLRATFDAWQQREGSRACTAVSHVGYGLNPNARWDALAYYDKRDCNGTELRAFAGNFLYSTGANETAGRHTRGHFDWPLRGCTITLDGQPVVQDGVVCA